MWFARRPINSWDRNAFISDVKYGSPSYTAQMNHVDHNMIIANVRAAAAPFASSSESLDGSCCCCCAVRRVARLRH